MIKKFECFFCSVLVLELRESFLKNKKKIVFIICHQVVRCSWKQRQIYLSIAEPSGMAKYICNKNIAICYGNNNFLCRRHSFPLFHYSFDLQKETKERSFQAPKSCFWRWLKATAELWSTFIVIIFTWPAVRQESASFRERRLVVVLLTTVQVSINWNRVWNRLLACYWSFARWKRFSPTKSRQRRQDSKKDTILLIIIFRELK